MLVGLAFSIGTDFSHFTDMRIFLLLAADVCFAMYIVTIEQICVKANPAILAMGQMFFCFLMSFAAWLVEAAVTQKPFSLPTDAAFWGSVIFIAFFIRGLYSIVQIYAQRYVSAMNTALIFSTEAAMTLLMAPALVILFGGASEEITPFKLLGCFIIILGVLYADGSVAAWAKKRFSRDK
jgi:drug/metabolite transporter (DMT)-like permease